MDSLTVQYIVLAVVFVLACYYFYRYIRKNFVKKDGGKDKDCGRGCCS